MTNIVLLTKDRVRLTEQCLRTLYQETPEADFNLTVVDDCSQPETVQVLKKYERKANCAVIYFARPVGIVGFLRNVGIWASERFFGRGDWLYLSDNDIAFTRGWLDYLTLALQANPEVKVLGGYQHPFHKTNNTLAMGNGKSVNLTDAVSGYSHMMSWRTWDSFGHFDQHAKGVCQSEDFAFCQRVREGYQPPGGPMESSSGPGGMPWVRYHVGYIDPPVIINCGLTNSEGKPAIGAEHFPRIPGLVYE